MGSALARALATRAQARGATALMMDVLAENHEMLALIRKHLPVARSWHAGPYLTVHVPLPLVQEEKPGERPRRERELAGAGRAHCPVSPHPSSQNGAGRNGRQRAYQWDDPAIAAASARQLDGLTFFREIMAGRIPAPPIMQPTRDRPAPSRAHTSGHRPPPGDRPDPSRGQTGPLPGTDRTPPGDRPAPSRGQTGPLPGTDRTPPGDRPAAQGSGIQSFVRLNFTAPARTATPG